MACMDDPQDTDVLCLCAAWCRLCDSYRVVLDEAAAEWSAAGQAWRWHWLDIEDEADLVGDLDVETFPTLVLIRGDQVRFAGPMTPQPEALRRLLRATLTEAPADARWPAVPAEVAAFAARWRASPRRRAG